MKRNARVKLIVIVVSVLIISLNKFNLSSAKPEVNILCFVANGFGDSYYINKNLMESYGWTVTTSGTSSLVFGCTNNGKNVNDTYTDVLVQDLQNEDLSNYDCILIPSGGHWFNMIYIPRILEIIQLVHEQGILVAGICTGMIVLAHTDILEGVEVAYNIHAVDYLNQAGANMTGYPVVSDQGIITGGFGGGTGEGPEGAPNEAFCEKIKDELELNQTEASFVSTIFLGFILIALCANLVRRNYPKK